MLIVVALNSGDQSTASHSCGVACPRSWDPFCRGRATASSPRPWTKHLMMLLNFGSTRYFWNDAANRLVRGLLYEYTRYGNSAMLQGPPDCRDYQLSIALFQGYSINPAGQSCEKRETVSLLQVLFPMESEKSIQYDRPCISHNRIFGYPT